MDRYRNLRWWVAIILVAVAPLVLVNVIGLRSPADRDCDDRACWHGWPVAICWRPERLYPRYNSGGLSLNHYPDNPISPFPASSRWPFDGAGVAWRTSTEAIVVNAAIWAVLLITSGIACRASHWVKTGKPQVSLATLFVITLVTSIYVGLFLKEVSADPACLLPAPTMIAGIVGLLEVFKSRRATIRPSAA